MAWKSRLGISGVWKSILSYEVLEGAGYEHIHTPLDVWDILNICVYIHIDRSFLLGLMICLISLVLICRVVYNFNSTRQSLRKNTLITIWHHINCVYFTMLFLFSFCCIYQVFLGEVPLWAFISFHETIELILDKNKHHAHPNPSLAEMER